MASSCPGNKKFLTAEASTKAAMRTEKAIDEFLNIINVKKFRELNTQWSNSAKKRFNIEEPLFMEDTIGGKLKAVPNKRMFKAIDNAKGIFYQEDEVPVSTSSPETIAKVKRVIESMGVKLQSLSDYLKGNPNVDARGVNALADLTRGIIAIAEGKENVAIVEETVHVATSMIEQVNPKLITEMISKIGNFKIYNQVLEVYKNNPKYQLPNGKPDIRKIKKEAVDKLIAEVIINQNEGSTEFPELMQEVNRSTIRTWWQKILDWFRGEYRKANINIFEEAAQEIMSGRTGVRYYNDNKLGVDRLFEENPELSDIGTKEQYSAYLQTIFPDSKVKDIVYHTSFNKFDTFKKQNEQDLAKGTDEGIYFSKNPNYYTKEGIKYPVLLNIKNPTDISHSDFIKAVDASGLRKKDFKKGTDGFTTSTAPINEFYQGRDNFYINSDLYRIEYPETPEDAEFGNIYLKNGKVIFESEYLSAYKLFQDKQSSKLEFATVFEPEQIHILGSKQDIEGFKEWMKTAPAEFKGNGIFFQISDAQKKLQKRILDTKANIEKRESKEEGDPILLDTEEANNWYVLRTSDGGWERITKRVTDRVKAWYKQRFPDKAFIEEEKELNEFKRSEGVKGHKFLEEIHKRFFDEEGMKRERPLERPVINNKVDREIYHKLEKYYVELIDRFSKDGKKPMVFSEVIVYDPKQKEAGTIDLLIVEENGRANIIDWKFLSVGKDATDIAWYKQGAYNVQLGRYKDILMKQYGVKSIGMNRAIPILFDINYKDLGKKDSKHELKGIVVGSVDVSKIKTLTLTPVSEESESTELLFEGEQGWQKLDNLIIKLNSLYKQIAKKKAIDEEERDFKRERLNSLRSAIRAMQSSADLTPLIETISLMRREGEMIIDDWNTKYRDTAANNPDINNSELSDFAESLREYRSISDIFRTIDRSLGHLIYNSDMENDEDLSDEDVQFRKDVLSKVQEEARLIDESYENVVDISKKFADKFMGVRNLVAGLLKPEAIVRGLGATFRGVSELPLKSLEILYKMITNAKAKATQDALKEVNTLLEIRTKLAERGGDLRQLVRQIYQKDEEGKLVNKLIYRYDKGFYDGVKNNSLEGNQDKNWLQDNIDMVAYKAEADEVLRKRIERINDIYKNNRELRESLILQENRKWDITRADFTGWDNYIIKRHPLSKWESAEYKELKKDADLLDLYNFIHSMNEKAVEAGYISNRISSTFLPWVRKSLSESIAWDFSLSAVSNWSKELTLRAGDVGYGQVNELTGEYEYAIPKYYSYDFTKDDKGYENVSEDIFKNMILYINHMEKYKYMSDIEEQLLLVKNIETFKQHLETARNGDVVPGIDGKPNPLSGNEENTRMFDTFLRALLYEQKYPLSAGDTPLGFGKAANYVKSAINKVAGREIYKIDEEASVTSLTKSIDAINRGFQLKTLGFEFISGAVNMFGGNIQMATQAGNYFKAKEFIANEVKLLGNKFKHDDERDMFIQLMDTFMPLKDDPTYERLKKAGMSTFTRGNFSDIIMMFMRQPELHLERSVFLTLLENMMVIDGRIVSIREHVKSKYKNRYTTGSIYRENSKQIENEIEELRNTKSIYATKKLVNGKLEIPGLDLSNRDELQRLTTLTRRLSRNATGALSDSDLNIMSFNVWTKSMMVFKNWIPKLVDTRFGEFRKIHDDFSVEIDDEGLTTGEKYDIGRIRLFFGLIGMSVRDKGNHIMNILEMNDKGIEILDRMYEEYAEKYERQTGDTMNLSREEFIDLIRNNLSNQMKELGMLLSLVAASFALGFIGPDDDDNRADKNFYRFWQRVFDRFIQELSFFYNPVEFQKILSGSAFPAIGLISDMLKAMDHFTMQVTGYDISNLTLTEEEVREKAQPIKNIARMFPGTKSLMTYGSIFSEDWAREFDITIQKETRK